MKIVIVGVTGLIGSVLVSKLADTVHEVVAASPKTGVNTVTGEDWPKRSKAPGDR